MKLIDFATQFPDEQSCRDFFRDYRLKEGVICRKCGGTSHYWMKTISQFQCKACRTRTTLRSGTVMESSNLPFRVWFQAIHMMTSTKKGFSALEVQRQIGRKRYEPVWYMMHKIRVAMSAREDRYELSGTSEIDEGFFSTVNLENKGVRQEPTKRGRGSQKKTPVLVMAATEKVRDPMKHRPVYRCKYFKMKVMDDLTSKTINKIVSQALTPDSKVRTDNYRGYTRLDKVVRKHTATITPPKEASKEFPWVHITISNAKRNLLNSYHHVSDVFLQNYLDEFTYKLNRRYFGDKLFDRLLVACLSFNWAA